MAIYGAGVKRGVDVKKPPHTHYTSLSCQEKGENSSSPSGERDSSPPSVERDGSSLTAE